MSELLEIAIVHWSRIGTDARVSMSAQIVGRHSLPSLCSTLPESLAILGKGGWGFDWNIRTRAYENVNEYLGDGRIARIGAGNCSAGGLSR